MIFDSYVRQQATRQRWVTEPFTCRSCGRSGRKAARGLCSSCYMKLRRSGELGDFQPACCPTCGRPSFEVDE